MAVGILWPLLLSFSIKFQVSDYLWSDKHLFIEHIMTVNWCREFRDLCFESLP